MQPLTHASTAAAPRGSIIERTKDPFNEAGLRPPRAEAQSRLVAIDFVKGTLVLVMVLYHWLNYFIGLQWAGYRYLRFLTPAFILVTGFLVSKVYLQKYSYAHPELRRRLVARGSKLLVLFVALNVVADQAVGPGVYLDWAKADETLTIAKAVFVSGTGRAAAFDILVSIAYFLLIAPVVLWAADRLRTPFSVFAAIAIAGTVLAERIGAGNTHLELLSIGLIGLAAGVRPARQYDPKRGSLVLLLVAYGGYLLAITRWNVLFPLQVIGVCLNVFAIYSIALIVGPTGQLQRTVIRLGEYSLVAYLVQIVALQALRISLQRTPLDGTGVLVPLLLAVALTVCSVEFTHALRMRSNICDKAYKVVFG